MLPAMPWQAAAADRLHVLKFLRAYRNGVQAKSSYALATSCIQSAPV